ncbi:unnamed protein product [Symbiodinium natans]|uniref:Uncharacterized protein n=1 Tax=Symbiodinium natans TaxID=878477 RepID=A0A812K169_9DINO|nr:unnamed protein product [Symbiodinium natans]
MKKLRNAAAAVLGGLAAWLASPPEELLFCGLRRAQPASVCRRDRSCRRASEEVIVSFDLDDTLWPIVEVVNQANAQIARDHKLLPADEVPTQVTETCPLFAVCPELGQLEGDGGNAPHPIYTSGGECQLRQLTLPGL